MTKLEQVAVAISGAPFPTKASLRRARAALKAMLGPTEKMELEADRLYFGKGPVPIAEVFNTMIQAAIDEKE